MSGRVTMNLGPPSGRASTSRNETCQIQSTAPESCDTRNAVADSSSAAAIASTDSVRACASLIRSSSIQLNISGDIDACSLSNVRPSALPGQIPYPQPSHTVHQPCGETRQKCYATRPKVLHNAMARRCVTGSAIPDGLLPNPRLPAALPNAGKIHSIKVFQAKMKGPA